MGALAEAGTRCAENRHSTCQNSVQNGYSPRVTLRRPPHQIVATVLGAGTMGAQIAAHLANAGVKTFLLDIDPRDAGDDPKARNAIVAKASKGLLKAKPPAYMSKKFASRITTGNFDDDLETAVSQSDLVIEAVIERLDIKQSLFNKVAAAAKATTILATNTSGIPIGDIAEGLDDSARKRLIGLHFFNPPRWMHLLEVIPSKYSDPAIVEEAGEFCDRALGKGVVVCRDTPNFIGNRIGIGEMLLTFKTAIEDEYTIEEVDQFNGKLMGRPKTGSFRLGDMVGLDVVGHVVRNLREGLSGTEGDANYDPLYDNMVVPEIIEHMLENKMLGDKTRGGFYKKTKDEQGKRKIVALDLKTREYRDKVKPRFAELKSIVKIPQLERKVNAAMRAEGRPGAFMRKVYLPLFNYAAYLTGTICDTPKQIDDAMCWGYGWELGPFALMDAAGVKWCADQMKEMGIEPAPAIVALLAAEGDDASWYGGRAGEQSVYTGKSRDQMSSPAGMLFLDAAKSADKVIDKNSSANLIDIGDGIACIEFRSKMNSLDEGVIRMLAEAPAMLQDKGFRGIVVGSQDENFCVGANLMQIMAWIMAKDWKAVDEGVAALQNTLMDLRHGPLPVVAAPYARALGGGVELFLHADSEVANADLFAGLVEIGVGLLPAGGGLKEIARRASEWAKQVPDGSPYPWVRRGFEAAAAADVSMSAFEARDKGWLRHTDKIVFHKSRVIAEAKKAAVSLAEAGYTPPDRNEMIDVIGANRGASFLLGAQLFEWGGYASEHDKLIASKIAHVLSGGMSATVKQVTSQDLLDLEREAFIFLCGEEQTLSRIQQMLTTGKPLRN
jgi:3-hydroxyacyl-CoA dehydrogenase